MPGTRSTTCSSWIFKLGVRSTSTSATPSQRTLSHSFQILVRFFFTLRLPKIEFVSYRLGLQMDRLVPPRLLLASIASLACLFACLNCLDCLPRLLARLLLASIASLALPALRASPALLALPAFCLLRPASTCLPGVCRHRLLRARRRLVAACLLCLLRLPGVPRQIAWCTLVVASSPPACLTRFACLAWNESSGGAHRRFVVCPSPVP